MGLSATTHIGHNGKIRLPRDTKPLFLTGKDGLLSLPTSVDFRPTRNEAPAAVRLAPPPDHKPLLAVGASPPENQHLELHELRPLAGFIGVVILIWVAIIVGAVAS